MNLQHIKQAVDQNLTSVPEPFKTILSLAGFDGIIELCESFGGTSIYIPHTKSVFRDCIRLQVKKEFKSDNYKELCIRYGLSERTVRNIIEE